MKVIMASKKIVLLVFIVIASIVMVACKNNDNDRIPDPGGNFSYENILVYLTEEASADDKVWSPSDFPGFSFSEIRGRDYGGVIVDFYMFYLTVPNRDNVLRAIYYLNTVFEVECAEVNTIWTGA